MTFSGRAFNFINHYVLAFHVWRVDIGESCQRLFGISMFAIRGHADLTTRDTHTITKSRSRNTFVITRAITESYQI